MIRRGLVQEEPISRSNESRFLGTSSVANGARAKVLVSTKNYGLTAVVYEQGIK